MIGSVALTLLIMGTVHASGNIKWYSDGGVDIITFEDKEVIHLSKDQLGGYFGKGKQPFKGKKIAITVNNSGYVIAKCCEMFFVEMNEQSASNA